MKKETDLAKSSSTYFSKIAGFWGKKHSIKGLKWVSNGRNPSYQTLTLNLYDNRKQNSDFKYIQEKKIWSQHCGAVE